MSMTQTSLSADKYISPGFCTHTLFLLIKLRITDRMFYVLDLECNRLCPRALKL